MIRQQHLMLIGIICFVCILSMGFLLRNAERFDETTNGQIMVGSEAEADILLRNVSLNGQIMIASTDDEDDSDDDSDEDSDDAKKAKDASMRHPKYIDDGSPWIMYPSLNLMDVKNKKTTTPNPTTTQVPTTSLEPTTTSLAPTTQSPYKITLNNSRLPDSKSITVFRDQQQSMKLETLQPKTTQMPTSTTKAPAQTLAPETYPETPDYDGTEVYLDNGILRVGFDLQRGASLFYVASKYMNDYQNVNLINDYDCGRMIQQSYYGKEDGSVWPFASGPRNWRWNPVQAGNYLNVPSSIKAWTNKSKNNECFTSFTTPRHWITGDFMNDVEMKQTVCLDRDIVRMTFKMTYRGTISHPEIDQELPAIYLWKGLSRLVLYQGNKPWKNDELTTIDPIISLDVQQAHSYATEHWAAYVSKEHGWGMGVMFPHTNKISYYLVSSASNGPEACAYLAPVTPLTITPGLSIEYDIFIVTGSIDEIRKKIYGIKNQYSMTF